MQKVHAMLWLKPERRMQCVGEEDQVCAVGERAPPARKKRTATERSGCTAAKPDLVPSLLQQVRFVRTDVEHILDEQDPRHVAVSVRVLPANRSHAGDNRDTRPGV